MGGGIRWAMGWGSVQGAAKRRNIQFVKLTCNPSNNESSAHHITSACVVNLVEDAFSYLSVDLQLFHLWLLFLSPVPILLWSLDLPDLRLSLNIKYLTWFAIFWFLVFLVNNLRENTMIPIITVISM